MPSNCTKTPENHGGEVFQLEHSFSDPWMILKAAKSHSSGHVGIICQQDLGSACALVLRRPGLGQLQSQREKTESVLGHQVMQTENLVESVLLIQSSVFARQHSSKYRTGGHLKVAHLRRCMTFQAHYCNISSRLPAVLQPLEQAIPGHRSCSSERNCSASAKRLGAR